MSVVFFNYGEVNNINDIKHVFISIVCAIFVAIVISLMLGAIFDDLGWIRFDFVNYLFI
jgi:hypothetical protein